MSYIDDQRERDQRERHQKSFNKMGETMERLSVTVEESLKAMNELCVVVKDIQPYSVALGVPAKVVKKRWILKGIYQKLLTESTLTKNFK